MKPDRFAEIESIFQQAIDLAGAQREEFLDRRCGADARLRAEVETLLRHEVAALPTAAVQQAAGGTPSGASEPAELIDLPVRFGRYLLLRKLGAGGMGAVYEAQQQQPQRTVALKLVHPTFASSEFLQRFQRESELLANLQHPGIVQVYDADTADLRTDSGLSLRLPYFAMEYVRGDVLDVFLRRHQPSDRQRIALMAAICDAVQHAHQHGVIHRDLKPGNILVQEETTRRCDDPTRSEEVTNHTPSQRLSSSSVLSPKILDFGVARSVAGDPQATLQTSAGQIIGTLAYMSPEQVRGDVREIDTRSDVYSLGVILFEMLAGRPPYELGDRSLTEVARTINEAPPPRLGLVRRELCGEIELIVATAMAKEKQRRYASAGELADDLRRYLDGRPIRARGDAALYVLRKFLTRHRAAVAVAGLLILALGAAAIIVGIYHVRSRDQERIAAAQRTVTAAFDRLWNEMLSSSVLEKAGISAESKVRLLRALAAQWLDDQRVRSTPAAEAAICASLGTQFTTLRLYADAEPLLRRALQTRRELFGDNDLDTAQSCVDLAVSLISGSKDRGEAEKLLREALRIRELRLPPDHLDLAQSLHNLAACLNASGTPSLRAEARALYERALAIRRAKRPSDHPDIAVTSNNLGLLLLESSEYAAAEPHLRESIRIREAHGHIDNINRAITLTNLGEVLRGLNRLDEAEHALRESMRVLHMLTPPGNPYRATVAFHLGRTLADQGAIDEAAFLLCESYEIRRAALAENDWSLRDTESELGGVLVELGRRMDGEVLLATSAEALWRGWSDQMAAPAGSAKRAAERLLRFYDQEGRAEDAARWRARVAQFEAARDPQRPRAE